MRHLIRSDRSRPLTCFEVVTVVGGVLAMPSHWAAVFSAFALAGAGHGWLSPIQVCWIGLLTGPLILVGWHHRRKWWGQALAMLLIAVLVAADYEVVKRTMKDTTNLEKVWRLGPEAVITWLVAWSYPQLVALATPVVGSIEWLCGTTKGPPTTESDEPYPPIR